MNEWEHLTKHAILGTGRQPFSLPNHQSPLSKLWAQLETQASEEKLLHGAALLTEYRRAGWQPPTHEMQSIPSQPETLPQCTAKAASSLRMIWQEDNRDIQTSLLREWLHLAQTAGQRVPFELLPLLLDNAKKYKKLWPLLLDTIGQRGHWLAKLNQDWQYFAAEVLGDKDTFTIGSHSARLAYLQQCRATNPPQARELLATSWQQEAAQERQEFLTILWNQLSLADADFLENCLNDRSQTVRQIAAQMLGSLADSRLLKQMLERLSHYIRVKKGRLKPTLEINLPAKYDQKWASEGIKEKSPSYPKMGEKAWWLCQMLLRVRPSFLLAQLELSAESYLKMLRKTDFADMLYDTLITATKIHRDNLLAITLVKKSKAKDFLNTLSQLAEALPDVERERLLQEYLKSHKSPTWFQMNQIVGLFPGRMSLNLSQTLIAILPQLLKHKKHESYKNSALTSLAVVLAPECYESISQLAAEHFGTEDFVRIYRFRSQMIKEFN